jgi:hypothetical protein
MTRIGSNLRVIPLLAGFVAACAGPTFILQQYDGPVRSPDTVAILRLEGKDPVDLVSIDGSVADAHVPEDARLHVEMLPGKHALAVANRVTPQAPPSRVLFLAEAGRFYRVVFLAPPANEWIASAHVFEIDGRSGARLKDATFTPARAHTPRAPAPVPPPPPEAPPAKAQEPESMGAAGSRGE